MKNVAIVAALAALSCSACGDDETGAGGSGAIGASTSAAETSSGGASGSQSSGSVTSTGAGGSAGSSGSGGAIPDFNGCTSEDYVDGSADGFDRTITVGQLGLVFDPKCLVVSPGQTVTFDGSFTAHPIGPGNPEDHDAGSPDSPIAATTSGTSVTFTFAEPGTFPYYCMLHGFGDGQGMAGVVHVRAQ